MRQVMSISKIKERAAKVSCFPQKEKTVLPDGHVRQVMRVRRYKIKNDVAWEYEEYFSGTKKQERLKRAVSVEEIYSQIRNVYDHSNVLIARRSKTKKKSALMCTGRGAHRTSA